MILCCSRLGYSVHHAVRKVPEEALFGHEGVALMLW